MAHNPVPPAHQGRRPHQLASVQEVAAYATVHEKTVRRWLAEGRLTPLWAGPRLIRIDLDEVDAMLHGER